MKPASMTEAYATVWTEQQRANWQALWAFICRLRAEGKIKGKARA